MTSISGKLVDLKKSPNSKTILSSNNGASEKVSSKGPSLKSPAKIGPKSTSIRNGNGGPDSSKSSSSNKKMESSPPKISIKTTTVSNKNMKISSGRPNLDRSNSHGDCSNIAPTKGGEMMVDQVGCPHGHTTDVCPIESKLKENHFGFETLNLNTQPEEENGRCESSLGDDRLTEDIANGSTPLNGDGLPGGETKSSFKTEEHASGDKVKAGPSTAGAVEERKSISYENLIERPHDADVDTKPSSESSLVEANVEGSNGACCEAAVENENNFAECSPAPSKPAVADENTKRSWRLKVWHHMDSNDLVMFPRPCKGRIPNFVGAPAAAEKLTILDVFKNSKTIKVNPDKPQEMVRFHTLQYGKRLLVPVPRLREGVFQAVVPPTDASQYQIQQACQRFGMKKWGKLISTDDKMVIDLIVLGSVVVDKKGHRIGKGEGFSDLEFAMLVHMNAINDNTAIVTTVHDDQVYDELPENLFREHDVPVDWIITPTQVIEVAYKLQRPKSIIWSILSNRRILELPILQKLLENELSNGQDCALKEVDSDVEETPYVKPQFVRRKRYNYSRSTGDPIKDNRMSMPQCHYYDNGANRYYHQMPPPEHSNNYGPSVMRNGRNIPAARRPAYYHRQVPPYDLRQPAVMKPTRETGGRIMNRDNRSTNNVSRGMVSTRGRNRSRSTNRVSVGSCSRRNRSDGGRSQNRGRSGNSPPVQHNIRTKSVEVQTVDKSRNNRAYIRRKRAPVDFSLRVKNIGVGVRVRDLKIALTERGVKPRDITWRGYKGYAFLHFVKPITAENNKQLNVDEVIKSLRDLPLQPKKETSLVIEPLQSKNPDHILSVTEIENSSGLLKHDITNKQLNVQVASDSKKDECSKMIATTSLVEKKEDNVIVSTAITL